ncbi:MAG TPA: N-acetylmuramoyl-L-alanine amidase [Xanthobacteraceae bacterium]|nr:N-acetylmuramoyl-L-alanine amidase [Xanthobacteraceae bacterium]
MSIRAANLVFCVLGAALLAAFARPAPAAAQGVPAPASDQATPFPLATDFRIGGDANQTRFVVDISKKIDLRAFTLADPYRVVIDLPQVTFRFKGNSEEAGRGLIKAFRFGLVMLGSSRIVLDLKQPARIENAFVLDAGEGQPARLVVDLAATDRESFLRAIALANQAAGPKKPPPPALAASNGDPRPLIVLDPGHGGIDNGTHAPSGENEKDIVLDFALMLRDKLERLGKYRVAMTRSDDTYVPLADRAKIAHERHAALFISVHADALRRSEGDAQGATVYTLSEHASDAEAARLADAENKADIIAGLDLSQEPDDVSKILIDLAQRETKTFSQQFAHTLVGGMKNVARMHKNPLKSAGFIVLKGADVPSVLIELGYVTNRDDLKQLMSEAWRSRTTEAIADAVDTYFSTRLAGTPVPTSQ